MKTDREKWDRRYDQKDHGLPVPDPLLVTYKSLLGSGRALDLACGQGASSLFVARLGYTVDAVDVSFKALTRLRSEAVRHHLPVNCAVADLDDFPLPTALYDLVMVFSFFSLSIISPIRECLKSGGILFYSTFNHRHTSIKPGFNPAYLVPPGGLGQFFPEFDMIVNELDAGDERNLSRLIARKSVHANCRQDGTAR